MTSFGYNVLGFGSSAARGSAGNYLWGWGSNGASGKEFYESSTQSFSSPVLIHDQKAISASSSQNGVVFVTAENELWAVGELRGAGLKNVSGTSSPVLIDDTKSWAQITNSSTGEGYAGLTTDGDVFTWGVSRYGQCGQGVSSGTRVNLYDGYEQLAGTYTSVDMGFSDLYLIKSNGQVFSTGQNNEGHLGHSNVANVSSPVLVSGSDSNNYTFIAPSASRHVAMLKDDGSVWGIGYGSGALMQGAGTGQQKTPVLMKSDGVSAACTGDGQMIISSDGTAWYAGNNNANNGVFGNGESEGYYPSATQLGSATNWSTVQYISKETGGAIRDGTDGVGALWTWGKNNIGQCGHGNTTANSSPVQVGSDTTWTFTGISNGSQQTSIVFKTVAT